MTVRCYDRMMNICYIMKIVLPAVSTHGHQVEAMCRCLKGVKKCCSPSHTSYSSYAGYNVKNPQHPHLFDWTSVGNIRTMKTYVRVAIVPTLLHLMDMRSGFLLLLL